VRYTLISAPIDMLEYFFLVRVVKCLEKVHSSLGKHVFNWKEVNVCDCLHGRISEGEIPGLFKQQVDTILGK